MVQNLRRYIQGESRPLQVFGGLLRFHNISCGAVQRTKTTMAERINKSTVTHTTILHASPGFYIWALGPVNFVISELVALTCAGQVDAIHTKVPAEPATSTSKLMHRTAGGTRHNREETKRTGLKEA